MPLPPPVMSTFLSANDIAMVWDRIDWGIGGKPAEFGGAEFRWRDCVALGLAGWGGGAGFYFAVGLGLFGGLGRS